MDLTDILNEMDDDENNQAEINAGQSNSAMALSSAADIEENNNYNISLDSGIGDISMDLNDILETLKVDNLETNHVAENQAAAAANAPLHMDSKLQPEDFPSSSKFDMDNLDWATFLKNYHTKSTVTTTRNNNYNSSPQSDDRKRAVRFQTFETVHNYCV